MGNHCGCVEKEDENNVVVEKNTNLPDSMQRALGDASERNKFQEQQGGDIKNETGKLNQFEETDKDVLKLQSLIQ